MASKRLRSENFTFHDKEVLVGRICKRKEILENKKTDAFSVKAKEVAWKQVANEYNALATIPRSVDVLKTCWDNMKRRYRKSSIEENSNYLKSGCGLINGLERNLHNKIRDVLSVSSEKFQNSYDSDVKCEILSSENSNLEMENGKSSDSDHQEDTISKLAEDWSHKNAFLVEMPMDDSSSVSNSSKTLVPCVLTLKHERTSTEEAQDERDMRTIEISPQRYENGSSQDTHSLKKNCRWLSKKRCQKIKYFDNTIAEAKVELAILTKQHTIAEEKRKVELHELQLQEAKLKIEILKLELMKKQSDLLK